jgi:MFS family permease
MAESESNVVKRVRALTIASPMFFVILMGTTSLFSDMTYEGGRSLSGQFLQILGASAAAVGVAAGAGEFLGYSLRFFTGWIADRTGKHWLVAIFGYTVQLLAIPALALVGRWEIAIGLLFLERIGKAIRNPSRDAMLSHAAAEVGGGKAFGIHEAMDQIGAFLGPMFLTGVLVWKGTANDSLEGYRFGFGALLISAILALIVLNTARFLFPRPSELESKKPVIATRGFSKRYWWYLAAVSLIAAGFADFPLVAFHVKKTSIFEDQWIPTIYAFAMAVDAFSAIVFGYLYDKKGLPVLIGVFGAAAIFAPFAFSQTPTLIVIGMALWGIGMGAQESIMRAAVGQMIPTDKRASAYGLFHTGFGISWFLGSALMGFLYDWSVVAIVVFSVVIQLAAIPLFLIANRRTTVNP